MNDRAQPTKQSVKENDTTAGQDAQQAQEEEQVGNRRFWYFIAMPSWMVSFFFVTALIIFLAIWWLPQIRQKQVSLEAGEQITESVEVVDVNLDEMEMEMDEVFETETEMETFEEPIAPPETVSLESEEIFDNGEIFSAEEMMEETAMGELTEGDLSSETSSRNGANKKALLKKYGGNAAQRRGCRPSAQMDCQTSTSRWRLELRPSHWSR